MAHVRKIDAMRINHQVVVFDASDMASESGFWAGVLEGTVDAEDDWHMVLVDGEPKVGVQLAPNHVPPDWPFGTPEQQIHLDLWVEDFGAAHDRVMSLGAKLLKRAENTESPTTSRSTRIPPGIPSACVGSNNASRRRSVRPTERRLCSPSTRPRASARTPTAGSSGPMWTNRGGRASG
jgi:glyoxalase superfamily protein